MGKMHLTIIASGLALLVGCAPETAVFKEPQTGQLRACKPICDPTAVPLWVQAVWGHGRCLEAHTNDTCIAKYTEAGWVRLTGDGVEKCATHWTASDGGVVDAAAISKTGDATGFFAHNVDYTGFTSCMDDLRR
jgi:hypothetical protein